MKFIKLFSTLYGLHYNRVVTKVNRINCYGFMTHSLSRELITSLYDVESECKKYSNDKTINHIPIYLKVQSEYGDLQSILDVIYAMNRISCPIHTVLDTYIGGYSSLIYLNGQHKIFSKNAKLFISDVPDKYMDIYQNPIISLDTNIVLHYKTYTEFPMETLFEYYYTSKYINYIEAKKYNIIN